MTGHTHAVPKTTFQNLEQSKRQRLMRAAEAEFARHEYARANLNRIASSAGVAKGSLYQYFENKEDFYIHVVNEALGRAWKLFERHIDRKKPTDCFELLVEAMLHMIQLQHDEPELAALYARVVFTSDVHARRQLFQTFVGYSDQFYARLIPWGIEDGLIDAGLQPAVVRFHVNAVGSHFQYVALTKCFPPWFPAGERGLHEFAHRLVDTIRRALAPPNPRASRNS